MKIGFFTDSYFPQVNGVTASVYETAKELKKKGHTVYIITSRYPNYKDKEDHVIRLSSMPFVKKLNIRLATHFPEKPLFDLYKKNFDIVHAHSGGTISLLGLEFAWLKNIPIVFTYHTLFNKYTHYFLKGLLVRPKMLEIGSRIFCNRCNAVIVPSEKVKNELMSYGVKKPLIVLPSGIDLKRFSGVKKGFLRKRLKLNDNRKILLTVGRLGKEKSIDFLIKVFELVYKEDKNTVLVIVGDGEDKKKLQNLANELGFANRVYFLGIIDPKDMPLVYKDADIFLFASTTETQGLVILEAMASGLAIVAVNDLAVIDIIDNLKNGIILRKNKEEYAKSILRLLDDDELREKLVENARQDVQKFSISTVTIDVEKLYKKLISEHKHE